MTNPPPDAQHIGQRLKTVADYVKDCERRAHLGEIMDLGGLDQNVVEICTALAALPQTEAQKYETQMTALIGGLEVLAETIRQQHNLYTATAQGE